MADSYQKEKPPARINLFLELEEGDAKEQVELPLRMLVLGDYTGRDDDTPVDDREVVNVNKDNFEAVMSSKDLSLDYRVENRLDDEREELSVNLDIEDMESFEPEQVARQVPELQRMVSMRNLLQDLRNRVVSTRDFRKQLEEIVQDEESLDALAEELGRLVVNDAEEGKQQPRATVSESEE